MGGNQEQTYRRAYTCIPGFLETVQTVRRR